MLTYLWIGLGSAVGGMARWACTGLGARFISETFPWGTLIVNVAGSLIIGALAVVIPGDNRLIVHDARAFLMIGLCGGFTTFSSFSLETLNLARNGEWLSATSYALASIVLCLVAVAIGYFGTAALAR
jgi:fluoride exporter